MHLEVAILAAKDGNAAALVNAMRTGGGCAALESVPGCRSARAFPGVENPGNVLILCEWDSVDAHSAGRDSEGFRQFREIAGPFFGQSGSMEHFDAG